MAFSFTGKVKGVREKLKSCLKSMILEEEKCQRYGPRSHSTDYNL